MATRSVRSQTLIAVRNVKASSSWYQRLLGVRSSTDPDHPHRLVYDRLHGEDGALMLQLHRWDAEDHPNLVDPDRAPPGHGVLLWFELDDFDAAVARAQPRRAGDRGASREPGAAAPRDVDPRPRRLRRGPLEPGR